MTAHRVAAKQLLHEAVMAETKYDDMTIEKPKKKRGRPAPDLRPAYLRVVRP